MSERSVQADVVKKATLKYKSSKLRGTTGTSVQGPKTYKEFYLVFRAVSGERKELELYSNEKRFLEAGPPKLIVDLLEVVGIHVLNGKRNEFYVEVSDGGMCLFETKSPEESTDWVSCLNAVLFAKGPNGESVLQYDVELLQTEHIAYHGAAILELRDGELILYKKTDFFQVIRWRLSHIRSFKAKKRLLTIFSGSRSSTGVGEFVFKSDRSVEITHAIETVVGAMAKDKKASKQNGGHSHVQVQNGGTTAAASRHWSSTIVNAIPDFLPAVYESIPNVGGGTNFKMDMEGYGKLDIPPNSTAKPGARSPPYQGSPEHEGGSRGGMSHASPTHRPNNKPGARPAGAPAPTRRVRRDYEDLDLDDEDEEEKPTSNGTRRVIPAAAPEEYSRLDREVSPMRRMSPGPPLPSRPHVPPPARKEDEEQPEVSPELYACVQKPRRLPATVHTNRPFPPNTTPKPALSNSNPDLHVPGTEPEEYGHLVHNAPALPPRLFQEEDYDTLDLVAPKSNGNAPNLEEYGKLDRGGSGGRAVGGPSLVTTPPHMAEQYGRLNHTQMGSAVPPIAHYEISDSHQLSSAMASAQPPQEEYGKLQHNIAPLGAGGSGGVTAAIPSSQPEEYGRLERPTIMTTKNPTEPSAQRVANNASGSGTGISNDSQQGPPPGYENTEIKQPSLAYKMSVQSSGQLTSKPQAPPRRPSTNSSLQKKVTGYVNVSDKGQGKVKPPLPPNRPQTDAASHEPSLKSGDMNGGVEFPIRQKATISSDYEDTGSLDFGFKPPQNATPSLQKSVSTSSGSQHPPPPAPRRGASVRNHTSTTSVTQGNSNPPNRPTIARKPPILKPKPTPH